MIQNRKNKNTLQRNVKNSYYLKIFMETVKNILLQKEAVIKIITKLKNTPKPNKKDQTKKPPWRSIIFLQQDFLHAIIFIKENFDWLVYGFWLLGSQGTKMYIFCLKHQSKKKSLFSCINKNNV